MMKPQALYFALSILFVQAVQAADRLGRGPDDSTWRTAGLLVGTVHDERLDRERDQWLPFDWTWNLVVEDDLLEDSFIQTQKRLDELWAVVDASDNSTHPLSESHRNWYQEQLLYLDPDLDRNFDLTVWIRNGLEVIQVPEIVYEQGKMSWKFPHYDSVVEIEISYSTPSTTRLPSLGLQLDGEWIKHRGDNVARVRFACSDVGGVHTLMPENNLAYALIAEPVFDTEHGKLVESRWAMKLTESGEAIANFGVYTASIESDLSWLRHLNPMSATIQTPTGDFRFMSGYELYHFELCGNGYKTDSDGQVVYPDRVYMFSCFDGAHAFLFTAVSHQKDVMQAMHGEFWSGNWHHETWTATRDENATLPDAFEQTVIADDEALDDMVFKNLDGEPTRVLDVLDESNAPARIIEIFGTWCPNCSDAGRELVSLREQYGDDLAVVGLAFEITEDFDRSVQQVKRHHEHIGTDWPILIAGLSDKDKASETLPVLDKVRSYPTLIFLDRNNEVQGVYSGFSGPATGGAYTQQRERFEKLIESLIK